MLKLNRGTVAKVTDKIDTTPVAFDDDSLRGSQTFALAAMRETLANTTLDRSAVVEFMLAHSEVEYVSKVGFVCDCKEVVSTTGREDTRPVRELIADHRADMLIAALTAPTVRPTKNIEGA